VSKVKTYLKHDKKNTGGTINFVLLEKIGQPKLNCKVSDDQINKAFAYYKGLD
jgi:3-dehydroquinate synthase